MARHVVPSFPALWQKHESVYIRIFTLALTRLAEECADKSNEDIISENLCPILNTICFEESRKYNCEIRTPDWEKPIQPITEDELKNGRSKMRPDFTCKLTNAFAQNPNEHEIPLHIECKRLGIPTSPNWIYNKNYVINGICRFDSRKHEYGKRALSGIMIGYILNMDPELILDEVNSNQKEYYSAIEFNFIKKKVWQSNQKLNRRNVMPKIFELIHLWVDLRA